MGGSGVWGVTPISLQSAKNGCGVSLVWSRNTWNVRFNSTRWSLTRCWKCGPTRSESKSRRLQQTLQRSWTDTENSYFKKWHIFFLSIIPQFHFSATLAMRRVCQAWVMRSSGGSVGRCCLNVSSCAKWCDPHLISHVFHCGWGSGRSLATRTQQGITSNIFVQLSLSFWVRNRYSSLTKILPAAEWAMFGMLMLLQLLAVKPNAKRR